jgi:DNA replication protein DnaC
MNVQNASGSTATGSEKLPDFNFQVFVDKKRIKEFSTYRFIPNGDNILFPGSARVGRTHLQWLWGLKPSAKGIELI